MALTLRQIDAFRAVMLTGTLTEAAMHLGISQPAISRLIADMEAEIGYNLFERTGRRVAPTAEADILIEEVKRALVGLDQIREAALEIGKFRYARLRLLTMSAIPSNITVSLIKAFSDRHPDVFVSLDVKSSDMTVEAVMSHQCDLGIVCGVPENGAYLTRTVLSGNVTCILPADHVLGKKAVITAQDLEGESFISYRPDNAFRTQIDSLFDDLGITRMLRYEGRTPEMVCEMVASGMGVSLVGPLELESEVCQAGLIHRPFKPDLPTEISVIWSRYRPLAAMAEAFIDVVTDRIKPA